MPIPALSQSYKHRLQASRTDRERSLSESAEQHAQQGDPMVSTRDEPNSKMRPPLSQPPSDQNDICGAKRRSLLPQPGHTRHTSLLRGTTTAKKAARTEGLASERNHPRFIQQTPADLKEVGIEGITAASGSLRPRPGPQTARLARSGSLRSPGVSLKRVPSIGHSRAQSTSIVPILPTEVVQSKTANERPRWLLVATHSTANSDCVPANHTSTAPRTSVKLAGLNRTASVKREAQKLSGSGGIRLAARPEDPVALQPRRREAINEEAPKPARPAFTTLQQNFTPRKTGKPPTSLFLHPTLPADSSSLSSEVVSLQSELLQLHLLHKISAETERRWQASAKRNLHVKYEEVSKIHQAFFEDEQGRQAQRNLQVLIEWSNRTPSASLVEYIQLLSGPLHELPSLVEPGGRFQRLVGEYKQWMLRVEHLRPARFSMSDNRSDLGPIGGLGDLWKAENAALVRKVTSLVRDLDGLGQPPPGSSVTSMVGTCSALLHACLDELQVMRSIEADVVSKEEDHVEAHLQAIALDAVSCLDTTWEAAVWRT